MFWFLIIIPLLLASWYYHFFLRAPKRVITKGKVITSPTDGKILSIIRPGEKEYSGKYLISESNNLVVNIVMNLFDFHYQRSPIKGVVKKITYNKGSFHNAILNSDNALLYNERNEILIKSDIGIFKVVQIAGKLARRIQCFVKKNEKINKGQLIGRILLGSQVSLIMPKHVKLIVHNGQRVKAGETVIGTY